VIGNRAAGPSQGAIYAPTGQRRGAGRKRGISYYNSLIYRAFGFGASRQARLDGALHQKVLDLDFSRPYNCHCAVQQKPAGGGARTGLPPRFDATFRNGCAAKKYQRL